MLVSNILLLGILLLAGITAVFAMRVRRIRRELISLKMETKSDALTGVFGRRSFLEKLETRFSSGEELHVLYVDLANFKETNDKFGHSVGDEVLRRVAGSLQDMVCREGVVGRLGGDEFAIIRSGVCAEEVKSFARTLYESQSRHLPLDDHSVAVDLSVGVALQDETCSTAEELLRRADRAMYEAKSKRSGPVLFHRSLDHDKLEKREVRADLREALNTNQLQLFYQPIFDARTGEIKALEALMRWPNKIGPAGSPGRFIPIAEETDLILELGHWSLKTVLGEIVRYPSRAISLNLSARQLLEPNFVRMVGDEIIAAGIDPQLLKFELTETVLIDHTENACRVLRQLRELGVQLLLDDFGTGYSSLSYLQKFQFDILKIDRAFVRELNNGVAGQNLLRAIIQMGRSLNMKVVAEGVETAEQAAILQLMNVDYLQGFFLGVPTPMENLTDFTLSESATRVFSAA